MFLHKQTMNLSGRGKDHWTQNGWPECESRA